MDDCKPGKKCRQCRLANCSKRAYKPCGTCAGQYTGGTACGKCRFPGLWSGVGTSAEFNCEY